MHLPEFSELPEPEMLALGVQYGKGLQLINILRDAGADLRQGRCYLPAEELGSLGLTPETLLREPERAEAIVRPWLAKAEEGVVAGIEYACAIRSSRVRFATALPAVIGRRTLALLREAGPAALERRVKVPRNEVRRMVLATAVSRASPRLLRCR
jgi:farnesyl-diphosphate farnesyltransferase